MAPAKQEIRVSLEKYGINSLNKTTKEKPEEVTPQELRDFLLGKTTGTSKARVAVEQKPSAAPATPARVAGETAGAVGTGESRKQPTPPATESAPGGGAPPKEPPKSGEPPKEPPKTPEKPSSPESPEDKYNNAVDAYVKWIERGENRRWLEGEEEDAKEIKRLELEAKIEETAREIPGLDVWKIIRPQDQKLEYQDPWDRLWDLYGKGRDVLKRKVKVNSLALDVLRTKGTDIGKFLDKDASSLSPEDREDLVAVRAAYGLQMALYYLSNPRHEEGQFEIRNFITRAKQGLDELNMATNGKGLKPDEILVRTWLQAFESIAEFWDYAIKPIHGSSMGDLENFKAAAHRFLVTEPILRAVLQSKKVSEAEHRAGIQITRFDHVANKHRNVGGLDSQPDYLVVGSENPKDDLLRIVGSYLNIITVKCNKTVKTTSTFLYPIYESLQTGLQRLYERGYSRMYGNAQILIDPDGEVVWQNEKGELEYQDITYGFYYGNIIDYEGKSMTINGRPVKGWIRLPNKHNKITGQDEIDETALPAGVPKDLIVRRTVQEPIPKEVRSGDILYGTLWNYHFYADNDNIDRFFKYQISKKDSKDFLEKWERQRTGREDFTPSPSGYVFESLDNLHNARENQDMRTAPGERFIGEMNLAWLLCRRGVTKELWDIIDPQVGGIDFEMYIQIKDHVQRRKDLDFFWQRVLKVIDNPQLSSSERLKKYSLLRQIIANNMAWGRTVYVNKNAFSNNLFTDGINAEKIPVLQAGLDFDEVYVDSKGQLRRAFDTDMLGRAESGKGAELQTLTQYIIYYVEQESPLLKALAENVNPLDYSKLLERMGKIDERGMFKSLRMIPEASDYIRRQMAERFFDRYVVGQADMVRRQGQKFAFMDIIYQFRHHLENGLNTDLHFSSVGLDGSYEKESGMQARLSEGFKRKKMNELGRSLSIEEQRSFEYNLLARSLIRRAMNENCHVDAWNFYARKKLTGKLSEAGMTDKEVAQILGSGNEGNLQALDTLLTILGLEANLTMEGAGGDVKEVNNFLRVRPDREIQRKDRFLKAYREITEKQRDEKLNALCKKDPALRAKLEEAIQAFFYNEILRQEREVGKYKESNLLLSYDFLDITHWVMKDLLVPYMDEVEFCWDSKRTFKANERAIREKMESEDQWPKSKNEEWYWSRGREYYWINQEGVTSINPHVRRWVLNSLLSGQIIPDGKYQGQYLYDPYETRELNHADVRQAIPAGTRNPEYNQRKAEWGEKKDESGRVILDREGKPIMEKKRELNGTSRVRSLCLGYGTRELDNDWTEGFPINDSELALIYFMGYFTIHKQQMVCAELADTEYARRNYSGDVEKVNNVDRKNWKYLGLYNHYLTDWVMATVGPDNAEGILADMGHIAHDPKMQYDPAPFIEYARKLGISREDLEMVARVQAYRKRLFILGLKESINAPRTIDGERVLEWANEATKKSAEQRLSLFAATGEIIGFKGADELIRSFGGIDFNAEFGTSKHRLVNLLKAGFWPALGGAVGGILNYAPSFAALGSMAPVWGPILAGFGWAPFSYTLGLDVKPEEIYAYTGFGPTNIAGVKDIIKFQDRMIEACSRKPLLRFLVNHNRRLLRSEAYQGKEGNASGGRFFEAGPYPSFISPKFMEDYLLVVLKYLRGAARK